MSLVTDSCHSFTGAASDDDMPDMLEDAQEDPVSTTSFAKKEEPEPEPEPEVEPEVEDAETKADSVPKFAKGDVVTYAGEDKAIILEANGSVGGSFYVIMLLETHEFKSGVEEETLEATDLEVVLKTPTQVVQEPTQVAAPKLETPLNAPALEEKASNPVKVEGFRVKDKPTEKTVVGAELRVAPPVSSTSKVDKETWKTMLKRELGDFA